MKIHKSNLTPKYDVWIMCVFISIKLCVFISIKLINIDIFVSQILKVMWAKILSCEKLKKKSLTIVTFWIIVIGLY